MGTCPCQCSKTLELRLLGPQYQTFYLCIIGHLVICHAQTLTVKGSEVLLNGIQLVVVVVVVVCGLCADSEILFLCTSRVFFSLLHITSLPSAIMTSSITFYFCFVLFVFFGGGLFVCMYTLMICLSIRCTYYPFFCISACTYSKTGPLLFSNVLKS